MASKFFLKLVVTTPVAPITTSIIIHFMIHIRSISIHKPLYFSYCRFLLHVTQYYVHISLYQLPLHPRLIAFEITT
jgi:hypothetical protein